MATTAVRPGPIRRAFGIDREKAYSIVLSEVDAPRYKKLTFLLWNSEFHCVAAYRFGQYASELRRRNPLLGALAIGIHRVANRWLTHIDHTEISSGARIGPGLLLMHRHGVLIGPVVIGKNCVLHQNVTIGQRVARGDQRVPRIGDNVWIGPGAVITGPITVGNGVTISAGTVLSKDVPSGCLVAGNPGRVVARNYDNSDMLNFKAPE